MPAVRPPGHRPRIPRPWFVTATVTLALPLASPPVWVLDYHNGLNVITRALIRRKEEDQCQRRKHDNERRSESKSLTCYIYCWI